VTIVPFALQASVGCPRPLSLALAAAAELRPELDEAAVDDALAVLRDTMAPHVHERPEDQLAAVASLAGTFERRGRSAAVDDLLPDAVLDRRRGHVVMVAVLVGEAAHRAGLPVGLIGDGLDLLLGHPACEAALVVDVRRAEVRLAAEPELRWRCGHQVAFLALRELLDAALRTGDLQSALAVARLRLGLPLDERTKGAARDELAALRARLN